MRNIAVLSARPRLLFLGAPVLFAAVYLVSLISGYRFDYARESFIQFVPVEDLAAEPWDILWHFHSQPPGFNALLAAIDRTGSAAPFVWQTLFFLGTCAALWMIADLVYRWTGSAGAALCAGVVAAVAPGTLFYSQWLYYTQPVAIALVVCVWALVVGVNDARPWGFVISICAMAALFLIRSTFAWPIALAWVVAVSVVGFRSLSHQRSTGVGLVIAVGAVVVVVIGLFTIKNVAMFGVWSQSSWSAEGYSRALKAGMTSKGWDAVRYADPCLMELSEESAFFPIDNYPTCTATTSSRPASDSPALLPRWRDGSENFNQEKRLALAREWLRFDLAVLGADPSVAVRLALPSPGSPTGGTLIRFLSPSADYQFLPSEWQRASPAVRVWMVVHALVPALLLVAWLLELVVLALKRSSVVRLRTTYVLASAILGVLVVSYVLLEFPENNRFRAELDLLLAAVGFTAGFSLWSSWRSRRATRAS